MDASSTIGLLAVFLLVLANGFFVATEFAIVAVRRSRLEELAAKGHPTAEAAQQIVRHLDAYIAACQLGITMASLGLGWIGEPALAHLIEPPLETLVGTFAPTAAHGVAIGISFAFITALHIVVGELAPKGLALQQPEGTALFVARPMQLFYLVFRLPITLLNAIGNATLRLAGLQPASGHEMVHSVEELRLLVTSMQEAGVVEESEARIASRVFRFGELTAGALMTPRTELEAIPVTITRDELLDRVAGVQYTRLPVYEDSLDNIVGVLHVRDLFRSSRQNPDEFDLRSLLRPVQMVPESKHADELLEEMRTRGWHLVVVLDEYGGTAGIVTLENLVEAIVGEITDEAIRGARGGSAEPVPRTDAVATFDGLTRLAEFEEVTGANLSEAYHEQVETLGGLVMAVLGRVPEVGDEVQVDGYVLRVEKLDGRRVEVVRARAAPQPTTGAAGTSSTK